MKYMQHLCALAIITIIMGLIYASVQQVYRTSANDPQAGIAHDLANRLGQGKSIDKYFDTDTADLEQSQSLFLASYNAQGLPLRSTAFLKGKLPQLPSGVINFMNAHGEDWITWQPQPGIRLAMVIVKSSNSMIVAAGKSLNETENRVSRLTTLVFICWLLCVILLALSWLVQAYRSRKQQQKQ